MCGYKTFHDEFLRCSTKNRTLFKRHYICVCESVRKKKKKLFNVAD